MSTIISVEFNNYEMVLSDYEDGDKLRSIGSDFEKEVDLRTNTLNLMRKSICIEMHT